MGDERDLVYRAVALTPERQYLLDKRMREYDHKEQRIAWDLVSTGHWTLEQARPYIWRGDL